VGADAGRRAGADAGERAQMQARRAGCDAMRCAARDAMRCAARDAMRRPMRCELVAVTSADAGAASWLQLHAQIQARRPGCSCMRRRYHAFDGGILRVGFFWDRRTKLYKVEDFKTLINAHTLPGQT
jgi:hypothetical protein